MDGFAKFVNNAKVGGKIWLFWDAEMDFEMSSLSDQAISGWFIQGRCRVFVTLVYASCFSRKRLELWDFLKDQDPCDSPWFIGGF